jgi:heme exporter protein CcmD
MPDWFDMGGYGPFVWGAYGAAILSLILLTLWVHVAHTKAARAAKEENLLP